MLIFQAIIEAPNQQLNLCDIYAWFQANFLHFRSSNLTWKVNELENTLATITPPTLLTNIFCSRVRDPNPVPFIPKFPSWVFCSKSISVSFVFCFPRTRKDVSGVV